jgi:O-methyltransferase
MNAMKSVAKGALSIAAHNPLISKVAKYITNSDPRQRESYAYLKAKFCDKGVGHKIDRPTRREIVRRFELIDRNVTMGSTPADGLFLAAMLINTSTDGPIVECGCFAGGSSAKLSILAKQLNRPLFICDSFEGLPIDDNGGDFSVRRGRHELKWEPGWFAAQLDVVKAHVAKYGEIEPCHFVKGWFSETLNDSNIPAMIGFAFADVDLPSSARDCFVVLWPRLQENGVYATHDVAFVKVLQEFYNPELWARWKESPPILFGAGFGLCNDSPHLGFMIKGNFKPEYLKSLTIDK